MNLLDSLSGLFNGGLNGWNTLASAMRDDRPAQGDGHVFTFGDPVPVLRDQVMDYIGVFQDSAGPYYAPPVSLTGLARISKANPHHNSILEFKSNMVWTHFQDNPYISRRDMRAAAWDYAVLENAYFQKIYNRLGGLLALKRLPAITLRRGVDPDVFFQVPGVYQYGYSWGNPIKFRPGEVVHIKGCDILQDVYGVPKYLGGVQAVLLSEDATLFRRKFYRNGAAMGYVFATINSFNKDTARDVEAQIKASIGDGNFSNLYLNIPNTNARDPVKVFPIGDIKTADDYDKIWNMNIRQVLAMHRMYPGIAGVIPDNYTGFGDLMKTAEVYFRLEVPALWLAFEALNEHLPIHSPARWREPDWLQAAT